MALVEIGAEGIPVLLAFEPYMLDTDQAVGVMEVLEAIGDPRAQIQVAEALRHQEPAVRKAAVPVLVKMAGLDAAATLLGKLEEENDTEVRAAIVGSLGAAAKLAFTEVRRASSEENPNEATVATLERVHRELSQAWEKGDESEEVRAALVEALAVWGAEASMDVLKAALTVGTDEVRKAAAQQFYRLAFTEPESRDFILQHAGPELQNALKDNLSAVRNAAAKTAGDLGNTKAVPQLVVMSRFDPGPVVRRDAIYALEQIGDIDALPALILLMRDPNPNIRDRATRTTGSFALKLSWIGTVEGNLRGAAIKALWQAVQDTKTRVRKSALEALEAIGWSDLNVALGPSNITPLQILLRMAL